MRPGEVNPRDRDLTALGSDLWWLAARKDKDDPTGAALARELTRVARNREMADIPRRFKNLTFFRHYTGRPVVGTYAFGMARRPSNFISYYGDSEFSPPRFNLIQTCSDIYVTRLLQHKTYISFVPDANSFGQRQVSQDVEGWIESGQEELRYEDARKARGINALCYGSGWTKWWESYDGGMQVTAPSPDELLFGNYDEPNPNEYIERVWALREDVYDTFGVDDESKAAVLNAPAASAAFFFGPGTLATQSIIPLLYGLRTKHQGKEAKTGREVMVVGNYTIYDKDYDDCETNLVKEDFHQLPSALFGKGIPEILLEIQNDLDEQSGVEQESFIRSGTGKWFYDASSGVNPDELGDTVAGALAVAPGAKYPEYVTPEPITPAAAERFERQVNWGMKMVHISENAVQGEVPKQLTSAVALDSWVKIDDINFGELIDRREQSDRQDAQQMVRLGKKLKVDYRRVGTNQQIIKWADLKIGENTVVGLTAFNVGQLGQTFAGQEQKLTSMLAAGTIDRQTYNKYLQVPDTQQMLDQLNAPETGVDDQLDAIVLGGYEPPTPFLNADYAIQAVEARYILEKKRKTPQAQLDNLLMWRAAMKDIKAQQMTPDASFGATPLPGSAPGAPAGTEATVPGAPVPIPGGAPAQPPPQQMAA